MVGLPIICRIIGCSLLSFALGIDPAGAQSSITVQWSDDGLSVRAHRACAALVFSEVSRQTGVRFRGLDKVTGTIDLDFPPKPLLAALQLMLEDFNYVIVGTDSAPDMTIGIHSRIARADAVNNAVTMDGNDARSTEGVHTAADEADQEQQEQFDAAERLADATTASLREAVQFGSAATRIAALRVLAERDPTAAGELAGAAIDDPDSAVSGAAIQALSQIEHPDAVKVFGAGLHHSNVAIRRALLELLFVRNDPESLADVRSLRDDPDPTIRARAAELGNMLERSLKEKAVPPNRR
jgi:hypothetical protein